MIKGSKHTQKTRMKMRLVKKDYYRNGGTGPFKDKHHTEEAKRKIGRASTGRSWQKGLTRETDDRIRRISMAKRGSHLSEEHKRNIGESLKGKTKGIPKSEEMRRKLSVYMKNFCQTKKGRDFVRKNGILGHKACHRRPNNLELEIQSLLEYVDTGNWKYVGDGSFIVGNKNPDFLNVNSRKAVIEGFGDYWHRDGNPQDHIDAFKKLGYDCLVIWEHELSDISKLLTKLESFLRVGE